MYKIDFYPKARKFLKKVQDKQLKEKLQNIFIQLQKNPYIGEPKTGNLSGIYCYDLFHNKTNYEIAYEIKEVPQEIVIVVLIGTRENFYKELSRST